MNARKLVGFVLAWVVILVFSVASVQADVYWESVQKTSGVPMQKSGTETTRHFMTENASRNEVGDKVTIMDFNKMAVYELDPARKVYSEMDLNQMGQLPGMDAEAQKIMQGMLKGMADSFKVTATNETRKVAGFKCRKYLVNFMMSQGEYWVSKDVPGYSEIKRLGKKLTAAFEKNPMLKQMNVAALMGDMDGFPVQIINNMMGGTITTTLKKIEKKKLDKALFKVPAGYKKVATGQM